MITEIDIAVLAGGLGTRLRGTLDGLPKIMAPIAGRPFLDFLLEWLRDRGARRVVLSLGYRAEAVTGHLGTRSFAPLRVESVTEPEPLGTAGAIAFARSALTSDPVLVINGDTFLDADLESFLASHRASGAEVSLLAAWVDNPGRYGSLEIDGDDRVIRFAEKDPSAVEPGWINAGFYLFSQRILDAIAKVIRGSLERDVLAKLPPRSINVSKVRGRFLDIGTPESLVAAAEVLQP